MSKALVSSMSVAEQIRQTGARATPARIRVLEVLRRAPTALNHSELEQQLGEPAMDRVTLYRVLDWLVDQHFAQKSVDAQRVFRFSATVAGEHSAHAHFRCEACGGVFCLETPVPPTPSLPEGFSLARASFDVSGQCALCGKKDHHE